VFALGRIVLMDYREHQPEPGTLVYCDPPYSGTLGYGGTNFESEEFWSCAASWRNNGCQVVVSESVAPSGWEILAERERKSMLRVAKGGENTVRREVMWV